MLAAPVPAEVTAVVLASPDPSDSRFAMQLEVAAGLDLGEQRLRLRARDAPWPLAVGLGAMMIWRHVTLASRFGSVALLRSYASCTSASVTLAGTILPSSRSFFTVRVIISLRRTPSARKRRNSSGRAVARPCAARLRYSASLPKRLRIVLDLLVDRVVHVGVGHLDLELLAPSARSSSSSTSSLTTPCTKAWKPALSVGTWRAFLPLGEHRSCRFDCVMSTSPTTATTRSSGMTGRAVDGGLRGRGHLLPSARAGGAAASGRGGEAEM